MAVPLDQTDWACALSTTKLPRSWRTAAPPHGGRPGLPEVGGVGRVTDDEVTAGVQQRGRTGVGGSRGPEDLARVGSDGQVAIGLHGELGRGGGEGLAGKQALAGGEAGAEDGVVRSGGCRAGAGLGLAEATALP